MKLTLGAPGQPPTLTFNSTVGVKYSIECSPLVPAGSWKQVLEVTADGSTTTVTLPAAAVQAEVQVYRVVQSSGSPPPPPPPPTSPIEAKLTLSAPGQPPILSFTSISETAYAVEWSSTVPAGTWQRVLEVRADGPATTVTLPAAAAPEGVRFYRILEVTP